MIIINILFILSLVLNIYLIKTLFEFYEQFKEIEALTRRLIKALEEYPEGDHVCTDACKKGPHPLTGINEDLLGPIIPGNKKTPDL